METPLAGVFVIEPERLADERGFFARTWCEREAAVRGLVPQMVQTSVSYNRRRGTLRGMHYQAPPHEEAKVVRCTRGVMHDVVIDLRPASPTFLRHFAVVLTAESRQAIYVPQGFAHGFQTLEDETEAVYQISAFYAPASARGVRWDDPTFGIQWPIAEAVVAERDRRYPDFDLARLPQ